MWRLLHIWWKNTNKRKVLYGNMQGLFFCKKEGKIKFWGGGGEWWWRKMVEEYDIGWRVVETLLF